VIRVALWARGGPGLGPALGVEEEVRVEDGERGEAQAQPVEEAGGEEKAVYPLPLFLMDIAVASG